MVTTKSVHGSAPLTDKGTKRVVKYGDKRSNDVYSNYDKQFELCSSLKDEIELIENNIKNKVPAVSTERGKTGTKNRLSSAQLSRYRRELSEKKYALKLENKKLMLMKDLYLRVNNINKNAAKSKVKKFNNQIRLSRIAAKRKNELLSTVTKLVQSLKAKKDPRIMTLQSTAEADALRFYNTMFQIVRTELKGSEVCDLLKASSSVRSEAFKSVRLLFGYKPKL